MDVTTRDFGVIQIEDDSVYSFPQGVYGFEDARSFAVFMHEEAGVSFVYLQAAHSEQPCFLVFSPWDVIPDYDPHMAEEDLRFFGVDSEKDLIFLLIATVPADDIRKLSVNAKSPVVLNPPGMIGRQVILLNEDYAVRCRPFLGPGDAAAASERPAGKAVSAREEA
ncbi:MAG: flagellar assembly protein FliW [Clostridiales Family XIII bacterium]|jgi:flagellar assembly factor FliW|nr:flagellar assembly protein FliW [Clostridiales Family XIII bacterium]